MPDGFPGRETILDFEGEWVNAGDSVVVSPNGQLTTGPLRQEYGIVYADIDTDVSRQQSWYMDTAGHYNRPDVFDVTVDRTRRTAIEFVDPEESRASDATRSGDDFASLD